MIKNKKILIHTGLIASVILIGAGTLFYMNYVRETPEEIAFGEQKETGARIKENSLKNNSASGSDIPPAPTLQTNGKSKVDMMISAVNQNDNYLQIRTILSVVTDSGICTLTMSKGTQTFTKEVGVQGTANTSTCKGFDLPLSDLSSGEWQLVIKFVSDTYEGSVSKTVGVQ